MTQATVAVPDYDYEDEISSESSTELDGWGSLIPLQTELPKIGNEKEKVPANTPQRENLTRSRSKFFDQGHHFLFWKMTVGAMAKKTCSEDFAMVNKTGWSEDEGKAFPPSDGD